MGRHLRPDAGVLTELARYGAGARRCEHMFAVTAQGSAITRFDRAVRLGVPQLVIAAAHELPKPVLLRDALRVVLVLAGAGAEEFPAAAARFGARMVSERRLGLVEAQLTFASLAALAGIDRAAGGEALCVLLERHAEPEAARYLEEWLREWLARE